MDVPMDTPPKSMIRFSVVYVNFHALGYIRDSIASLRAHHADEIVEYVVVSNSPLSPTDMDSWTDRPLHLNIIQLDGNHGFSYANNAGVWQSKGEYVFLLNPDTLVHSPILHELEQVWNRLENPGAIGPLTRYEDGSIQNTVRTFYKTEKVLGILLPFPLPMFGYRFLNDMPVPESSGGVDVVNGSAMFFSKEVYEKMGGMDEDLFLYWEEEDICLRLRNAGHQVWFERSAEITHLESRIAKRTNLDLHEIRYISKFHYLNRHHPEDVGRDAAWSVVVFFIRLIVSLLSVSSFRIRLNARLLGWHFRYVMRTL